MKVLSAHGPEGCEVSAEQYKADMPEIKRKHKKAMKDSPTWKFFGGVIYVGNRSYQVSP